MTDKEEAERIMAKYHRDFGTFSQNATRKEYRFVLRYVAGEAHRKQREIAGLSNDVDANKD